MTPTSKLTPVLSANWDEKDSFTIEGYKRSGGYKAVTKASFQQEWAKILSPKL